MSTAVAKTMSMSPRKCNSLSEGSSVPFLRQSCAVCKLFTRISSTKDLIALAMAVEVGIVTCNKSCGVIEEYRVCHIHTMYYTIGSISRSFYEYAETIVLDDQFSDMSSTP